MNKKLLAVLLILSALFRLLNLCMDITYLVTQTFHNDTLFAACLIFLVICGPLSVLFSIIEVARIAKSLPSPAMVMLKGVVCILFIQVAVPFWMIYVAVSLVRSEIKLDLEFTTNPKFCFVITALLQIVFEAIPQIAVQSINNDWEEIWDGVGITAIVASCLLILHIFSLWFLDYTEHFISTDPKAKPPKPSKDNDSLRAPASIVLEEKEPPMQDHINPTGD